MKRLALPIALTVAGLAFALLWPPHADAQPPAGYYDSAEGLQGQALRAALHNIIDNHDALSYDALWGAYYTTDAKPGNKVWDMYSDVPGGTAPYVYTLGSDQCGSYNEEGDCYNREHSFPQSWFNSQNPMRTDLFHVYPTDGYVNNRRGNLPYGEVGSADWTSDNQSKVGLSVTPGYNGTVFEPIDAYKGDFARTYFYMMTRYYGEMSGWSSPMLAGSDLATWARNLLLAWHDQDPVSPKETARNNAVYALQDNRNPFIDRPEWVHDIWGSTTAISEQEALIQTLVATGGKLELDLAGTGTARLAVLDLSGRTVLDQEIPLGHSVLSFSQPKGLYIATVTTGGTRAVQRFLW